MADTDRMKKKVCKFVKIRDRQNKVQIEKIVVLEKVINVAIFNGKRKTSTLSPAKLCVLDLWRLIGRWLPTSGRFKLLQLRRVWPKPLTAGV